MISKLVSGTVVCGTALIATCVVASHQSSRAQADTTNIDDLHVSGSTYLGGPVENQVSVTNEDSEIFTQFLTGTGHDSSSDVCGIVVRNGVTFDTSSAGNQACALYGEVTSTRSSGSNPLINYAIRGKATGGTSNYAFFCDAGSFRCDAGGEFGPLIVEGAFTQSAGDVSLAGNVLINGATHVQSHNLTVDGTTEIGGNLTADSNLRVNGYSNLAGGAGLVYLQSIDSSGIPVPFTNAVAPVPERLSTSTAANPALGLSILSGSSISITLANGTKDGQLKMFAVGSGGGTITPANLSGGTYYSYSGPAALTLAWDASGGTWLSISSSAMTLH